MRKRPLMLFASVFLAGLIYQRYSLESMALIVAFFILREWYFGRKTKKYQKIAGRSILLLSAFLFGIFHMQQEESFRAAYMSKIKDGDSVTVWGELIKMEPTEYKNRGILSDCYIKYDNVTLPCNDIMVYTSNDQFQIGQIHKITGKINMFSKARNEGNFDSSINYQSLKIDFAVDEERSTCIGIASGSLKPHLLALKEKISQVYSNCLSKKAMGFYQAMVLGDKMHLDETLKGLFLLGGISHILAISGLHVSILGRGLYRILRWSGISFGGAGIASGFLLASYCVMVGCSSSTLRAVGMMLLFFLAQWMGRSYDMQNALGGMVLFLLGENPFLIENSGFWFSVTALLGVGIVGKSGMWMNLAITLTTLPVTALSYYEIPMYSPLVNLVALPILTPTFCLAVLGGILGCFLPLGFVAICLKPCEWVVGFYEWICQLVAKLPFSNVICGKPEVWQVILYYLFLLGGVCMLRCMQRSYLKKTLCVGGIVLVCGLCIFWPKERAFEISFLDVGQGDAIYICSEDGTTYFIDGGSTSVNAVGKNRILPFLKSKGVKSIDYWFVSHADTDHVSGLYEVLDSGYFVKNLVIAKGYCIYESYLGIEEAAKASGTKLLTMQAGDYVCSKNIQIECLGPLDEAIFEDENESSLVLLLKHKKVRPKAKEKEVVDYRALFAGDISIETENTLCKNLCDVDLVKANHHGSNASNGELWLEVLCPEYIVISCAKDNLYGHPGSKALERMKDSKATIFYTMENGQIRFPLIQ
ncbi:MAG: DNA internalization-related competence protein ComEC/Rec2 [Agathobacter sp.]|nr:DNA internalization-related competence protein ComEC/Rec2 [Agathobacter sp.]